MLTSIVILPMLLRMRMLFVTGALSLLLMACGAGDDVVAERSGGFEVATQVGVSPLLHIDRKYKSMEGPSALTTFTLQPGPPEILWITAYRTEVVDTDGRSEDSLREFMCHNNLNFDAEVHRERFGLTRFVNFGRMFTASQGALEIVFPEGFGIPVLSDEPLEVQTMVLNHNREDADLSVRHRITVEFMRDADAPGRLRPLYPVATPGMALLQGPNGYYGLSKEPSHEQAGSSCAVGIVAPNAPKGTKYWTDPQGRVFTQHWVVPPGREVRHTLITRIMNLPFDTTLHFINAHLHPFAESVELRDLTTDETLFRAAAHPPDHGIGLAHIESFTSPTGIPVYLDHEYEIVSVYENPTGVDQDAMAVLYLYFYDAETDTRLESMRRDLASVSQGT